MNPTRASRYFLPFGLPLCIMKAEKQKRSDTMATEFELKYRTTPVQRENILRFYPDGYTHIPMTTTYYDAPDWSLSARHFTLRHRQEGQRHVCTLKTPAPGGARGEWEVECGDISAALGLLEELSGEALPRELIVRCGARFERLAKMIEAEAFTAELALDQGILLNGEKTVAFAEAELELKSGSRQAMESFAREFAQRFDLKQEPKSKYARAKQLGTEG